MGNLTNVINELHISDVCVLRLRLIYSLYECFLYVRVSLGSAVILWICIWYLGVLFSLKVVLRWCSSGYSYELFFLGKISMIQMQAVG